MDCGMRFLAALALLWATSTRAASISRVDQASLVQQLVRDNRDEASMSFDKASLTAAVARTAMNHSYPLIMKDSRKRAVFMHVMSRITKLVGAAGQSGAQRHNARDLQSYLLRGVKREAIVSCAVGPGLALFDFGLNMPNTIDSIIGCAGQGYCLAKEILGLIGTVGEELVGLFNIEQDCGKPFLNELLDCTAEAGEAPPKGYFGMTPEQKNLPSFIAQSLTWATAGTAAVMGALDTCKAGNGSLQTPVHPGVLIPTAAVSFLLSGYEFYQMLNFKAPEGGKGPGRYELCGVSAGITSDALGLFTAIVDTVSHVQYGDGSDATKGFLPLCMGEIAGAVNILPDMAGKFCGFRSCFEGFPRAAFRTQIYGGSAEVVAEAIP